jgi:hypothetical protein
MESLGVSAEEIDIRPSSRQMLEDIGHPFASGEEVYDVTFENVQAGERTSHLFRLANHHGGLVLGTGDLSELALGWTTYGVGDHMSHYNVNASVPEDADPVPDPLGGGAGRVRGRHQRRAHGHPDGDTPSSARAAKMRAGEAEKRCEWRRCGGGEAEKRLAGTGRRRGLKRWSGP